MTRTELILIGGLLVTATLSAKSMSNDFGRYTGDLKPLSASDLRARLQIAGDIYVVDSSGNKVLFRAPERRQWSYPAEGEIESNWSAVIGDYPAIALRHIWTIGDDGVLRVKFQQYDSMKRIDNGGEVSSVRYGKLLKEEERVVTDFAPVTWTAFSNEKYKMVLRFIPTVKDISRSKDIADFPVAGTEVLISDNQGHTWTQPMERLNDKYIAFITHRGEIALSYYPFPGSNKVGEAKGNLIEVPIEKGFKVRLTSGSPFVPGDMTSKVYALYRADRKSSGINSTHVIGSDKEADFANKLAIDK